MAVPEGATKLGTVGIAYKGVYDELATYKYANAVYYNGSTYIALIDNPAGFPRNDGVNWRYLAQGFLQQAISALTVIDESGILGEVDAEVNAQEFLSKIAELEQGLEDTKANKVDVLDSLEEIVANTEEGRIAGANALSELNSNLTVYTTGAEEVIGSLDGKTLYRKRYKASGLNITSNYVIDDTLKLSDVDMVVSINGACCMGGTLNMWYSSNIYSPSWQEMVGLSADGLMLFAQHISEFPITKYYIEVVYTKV